MSPLKWRKPSSLPSGYHLHRLQVADLFDEEHHASQSTVLLRETYGQVYLTRLRLLRKTTLLPLRVRGSEQRARPSNPWLRGCSCPRRRSRKVKKEVMREPPMNRAHSTLSVVLRLPNRIGQLAHLLSANLHLFGFCYLKRAIQHLLHLRNVPSSLLQRFPLVFHLLSPV